MSSYNLLIDGRDYAVLCINNYIYYLNTYYPYSVY